jgi:Asp-tRNA(Asn)/Glu-tRNA(Gln) amidotransferase A subunit family amidase
MMDAVNGPDAGAPYIIPKPERPYLEESTREPGPLKIAFTKKSPLNTGVHPDCQKAVENAAALLTGLGHHVDETEPAIDGIALAKTPYTQLANVTGLPSMSVPLHWTADRLPCGVQFIAPFGDEATLFRLAGQLEKTRPWFGKRPAL